MKKILLIVTIALGCLTSCKMPSPAQKPQELKEITVYSEGEIVFSDTTRSEIKNTGSTIYYYQGEDYIEVSGTFVIKTIKEKENEQSK